MSSHSLQCTVRGALAATAVAALVIMVPAPAVADPDLPDDAPAAVRQLAELNHQAEVLTEQWHLANDELEARRAELGAAHSELAAAHASGDQARLVQDQFRGQVDVLTNASFQGARLNQLSALLISDSPQEFLDQMSALDVLATDNQEAMNLLSGAVGQAEQAETTATGAEGRAVVAEAEAARLEGELTLARDEMDRQIGVVEDRLEDLTADERASYTTPGDTDVSLDLPGSGVAAEAARFALSKQGSPYSWGAEGPDSFDCSGLLIWSFSQAGYSGLPRSSSQQARVGSGVSRDQLQAGDLIALYSPVSHIGIYIGDGRYVNAPQSGDVVKVSDVPWEDVTAMRRVG